MKKIKKKQFVDFVYGVHAVIELCKAKRRKIGSIYTTKKPIKMWNEIQKYIPSYVPIQFVTQETMDQITGKAKHQNILAFCSPFTYEKKLFPSQQFPLLVLLENIQDVGNLGAILRTCYCAGVDGIILHSKQAASLTAAVSKASAGLSEHLRIYIATSLPDTLQKLKNDGYELIAGTGDSNEYASEYTFALPTVLIIGNEHTGISSLVKKESRLIALEQKNKEISYNASVAAGIFLYQIVIKTNKFKL